MMGFYLFVALMVTAILLVAGIDYRIAGLIGLGCAGVFAVFRPRGGRA
jgi:hypothetical protein